MIISIGGSPGSGKTVVAQEISKQLGFEVIDIGGLRRIAAKERGMTLEAFNTWSEQHPSEGDEYFDNFVKSQIAKKEDCIVVGRLGYFLFPKSLKIYLAVSLDEGARRIFMQKQSVNTRNESVVLSIDDQKRIVKERMASDSLRYYNLYNTDCYDTTNFDVVIDTTNLKIEESIQAVLLAIQNKR